MQQAEANNAGSQRVPGVLDHGQAVVADAEPAQALQPTIGSLDHPADFPQAAAVRCPALGDVRLAAVAPVGVPFGGQLLGATWRARHLREVQHPWDDLPVVAGVRRCRAESQRYPMPLHQQRVFGAHFSAVYGAGAGQLATAEQWAPNTRCWWSG